MTAAPETRETMMRNEPFSPPTNCCRCRRCDNSRLQTRTIIWKFERKPASPLEIACHEPGHYEAGMKLDVVWAK